MRTLESVFTPGLSRLGNWVVESSLVEGLMDGCVAYGCGVVVAEVAFDAASPPVSYPSELKYEVDGGLWGSVDRVGFVGFDLYPRPPVFLVDAAPAVDCFLVGS